MNIKDVEKWIDTAKVGSSVIYYSGNLSEDRCLNRNVAIIPDEFAKYAISEKNSLGRIDFFQKRKTKMEKNKQHPKKPIFDYIARKIK